MSNTRNNKIYSVTNDEASNSANYKIIRTSDFLTNTFVLHKVQIRSNHGDYLSTTRHR